MEQVIEIQGQFNDVMVISELRGAYPNVPIAADVDYAALIAGDPDPVFVTLPIGKANVTSGNKRHYDEAFLQELERQTLANKPVGLMGHMTEAERATSFKPEAVHWVGAIRDGDTLWGKAYLLGEARDRLRRYKASGKQIATSIDATAKGDWDESLKAYRMDAKSLKLGQIDLAPADRAGIGDLARVPFLTTEMEAEPETEQPQEEVVDKLTIINEMTAEDARLLPETVKQAVLSTVQTPPEVAQVQELRAALGVDEKADLAGIVTEMRRTQDEQAKNAIKSRITELASDVKVEDVRNMVIEMVSDKNPQTIEDANSAYARVVEMASIKRLLAANVQKTMGPRQTASVQSNDGGSKYFSIPQGDKERA